MLMTVIVLATGIKAHAAQLHPRHPSATHAPSVAARPRAEIQSVVDADDAAADDQADEPDAEREVALGAGVARLGLGSRPVAGRDGRAALARPGDGEDADQPTAAERHEDGVAHVVVRRVLQRNTAHV